MSCSIFVLTHSPSPYQVELFNKIAAQPGTQLFVAYLFGRDPNRAWSTPSLGHEAVTLDRDNEKLSVALPSMARADVAVFNFYLDSFAASALKVRAVSGKPWVFWGERPGYRIPARFGRLVRRWRLRFLHACRAPIWGIGRVAVDTYRKEFGGTRRYHNIPYFSDLTQFQTIARTRRANDSPRTFLFSGSLTQRKGVDLLIKAFVRVAGEFRNVRLKLMGIGPLENEVRKLRASTSERVEFIGFKDWSDLPDVYASADILCVPSRYDGWGLVVPEGLAAGMPVIATDKTGAAFDFIETGRNGWLVRAGDEESLFAAMREATQLPPERLDELGKNARESVREHTLEHGARRFLGAAQEAVNDWHSVS
jgi:glycosyltransferase involved in cell wall biosynthesis